MSLADTREVGRILRNARKGRGRELKETAEEAGISESRLRQLEAGHVTRPGAPPKPTSLTRQKLIALCKVLGISVERIDYVLGLAGYAALDELEREQIEPAGRGIVFLDEFSPEQRDHLLGMVEKFRRENRK